MIATIFIDVSKLKNSETKAPLPYFLVGVFLNEKIIFDITSILGFKVMIIPYKAKSTKQCYNCQHFNHSSGACYCEPVSVKCAQNQVL